VVSSVYVDQHHWRLLLAYSQSLFEEVCFPLEEDEGHPRERVGHTINVRLLEGIHEGALQPELDVLTAHETRVHAEKVNR
jgi:hypothetical protein